MHAALATFLWVLLLLQGTSQCCWQHSHECLGGDDECVNHLAADRCDCCQHRERPSSPCKGKLECRGICTYVLPQKILIDSPTIVGSFMVVEVDSILAHTHSGRGLELNGTLRLEPPLRLHLLHQIVLI